MSRQKSKISVGEKYGMLLVVGEAVKGRTTKWIVSRDCGVEKVVFGANLTSGLTRSCGCARRNPGWWRKTYPAESLKQNGLSTSDEYGIWSNMHKRCSNEGVQGYQYYGGRGIKVCDRWLDFNAFLADMGKRPSRSHSIDRIDVNGNYEPSNCRWATWIEQGSNRRNNRKIDVDGEVLTVSEWARRLGCGRQTISNRLNSGWDPRSAVLEPVKNAGNKE